jgi:hypothetical protein
VLSHDRLTIGRDPSSDIFVDDMQVSRHHADLIRDGSDWTIVDVGSTNGVRVNGASVRRMTLRPGDRISLGDTELILRSTGSSAAHARSQAGGSTQRVTAAGAPPAAGTRGPDLLAEGRSLLEQHRYDESRRSFLKAAAIPAAAAEAHYGLGVLAMAQDDKALAQGYFREAVRIDPRHANALFQLGYISEHNNASADAVDFYRRALSVNPAHAGAIARLRQLGGNAGPGAGPGIPAQPSPAQPSPAQASPGQSSPGGQIAALPMQGGLGVSQFGVYEFLVQDGSALSKQAVALMDALQIEVRPRFAAYVGHSLRGFIRSIFTVLFTILSIGLFPLIGYLRVRCTKIRVAQGRLQIEKGVFSKHLKNVDIWRVLNIELERTLVNRMTGDGTLVLILSPLAGADRRRRRKKHAGTEQFVDVIGLAHGSSLQDTYQQLLNLTFMLRGNPVVKGIIQ